MSDANDDKVRVVCACGAKFKAPASKAGMKGPCPKCGQPLVIPHPEPAPADEVDWSMLADAAAQAPAAARGDDGYDLADGEEAPAPRQVRRPAVAAPAAAAFTPAAGVPGAGRALDYRGAGGHGSAAVAAEPGAGRFVLGVVLALTFGLVSGAIWMICSLFFCSSGLMAIGVGAAVGGGMLLGYGRQSVTAGAVSSVIAAGAILMATAVPAALIALAGWGVATVGQEMALAPYSATSARFELPDMLVDDVLAEQGLDYNATSEEQDEAAYVTAEERVAAMSEEELELTYKRQQVSNLKEMDYFATMLSDIEEAEDVPYDQFRNESANLTVAECDAMLAAWQPASGPGFWSVFGQLFGMFDVLWIVLALGMAFKISGL